MISTSNAYKQQLIAGNRNYVVKAEMTLADETSLNFENEQIWEQGVVLENAISSDSSFDIGSAIIGSLSLTIDNISGNYNAYDFLNANVVLYLGVTGDLDENDEQVYYRIGYYVVDDTQYNGSLITLDCLDNMTWFDTPFSGVNYPTTTDTTAGELVSTLCSHVGVTLGVAHFPNYTTQIKKESLVAISENDINCREVLQYVAQKCCCYCKINTAGELILTWYDKTAITGLTGYDGGTYNTTTTPYSDGDDVDGGTFDPWSTGDVADGGTFTALQNGAWLTNNFQMSVATDEIVVTGCRVVNSSGNDDEKYDELWADATVEQTHDRYLLVIENNPLILADEAANVANVVGSILAGLPIRAFSSSSLSDFSYETGDMVTIIDFRGNMYHTWITNFTFTINNSESFACGAESIKQRSETRFSTASQIIGNASQMLTDYDKAVQSMNDLAQQAIGYNKYVTNVNGGEVTFLYNGQNIDTTDPQNPTFTGSTVVFKITGDGVFISNDGGATYSQGYDANSGTAILSLLYAVGISCDWLKTGTITLGGYNNMDGKLIAYANTSLGTGSYSGTTITQYIGYNEVGSEGTFPVDVTISNVSSADDYKGKYRLYHTTDGANFTLIEESTIDEGISRIATPLEIVNDANNYYQLLIYEVSGYTATFDYDIRVNKVVTTIDRNGIATTNGQFTGNITGSTISGSTVRSWTSSTQTGGDSVTISGGLLHIYNTPSKFLLVSQVNGSGNFAIGGDNCAGYDSSHYYGDSSTPCPPWGICKAGYQASSGSDRRLKENIESVEDKYAFDLINNLNPVSFTYKNNPNSYRFGLIAQEVREVLDELGEERNVYMQHAEGEYETVEYQELISPLIKMVQIQQREIDELKAEIADLKARVK